MDRDSFQAMVDRQAESILAIADESLLDPPVVLEGGETRSTLLPEAPLAIFAVAVIAPTVRTVPVGGDQSCYGDSSTHWRPFSQQEFSLADSVKLIAERLNFKVAIMGVEKIGGPVSSGPGIVLIDPWFAAADQGFSAMQSTVSNLPRWVQPLLVLSAPRDAYIGQLTQQITSIINAAGAAHAGSARRTVRCVSSVEDFVSIVPVLVADAERQYLRHSPVVLSPEQPGPRPRLGGLPRSEISDVGSHFAMEAPDA